jgi:RNA polymerase sigma-70 factor, ECF subfamily
MQSDEELMKSYQAGKEEAFNALYEKYAPMVYGFIKRRLRSSEVDDFYQKVWRHLHEKRALYQGQPFGPWFFVLMRNLLTDEYRSLARKGPHEHKAQLLEKIYAQLPDLDLTDELAMLPLESRELVEKYYLEGKSYEELGKESGLTEANLRQKISRAIRSLRKKIEDTL